MNVRKAANLNLIPDNYFQMVPERLQGDIQETGHLVKSGGRATKIDLAEV